MFKLLTLVYSSAEAFSRWALESWSGRLGGWNLKRTRFSIDLVVIRDLHDRRLIAYLVLLLACQFTGLSR